MNMNVSSRNVGNEFYVAVGFKIEDQRALLLLPSIPKFLGSKEHS